MRAANCPLLSWMRSPILVTQFAFRDRMRSTVNDITRVSEQKFNVLLLKLQICFDDLYSASEGDANKKGVALHWIDNVQLLRRVKATEHES